MRNIIESWTQTFAASDQPVNKLPLLCFKSFQHLVEPEQKL